MLMRNWFKYVVPIIVLVLGVVSILTVMISVEVVQRMELLSTGAEKGM